MGNGTNFPADLLREGGILRNCARSSRIELVGLLLDGRDIHAQGREQLPYAVMQPPRNLPALFIAHLLQPA